MSEARLIIGDVFDTLATIPDNSIDLILTSPPFLALRSYLPADHPDKGKEIGSEPTPGAFIDTLLELTEEWARVLAPHGSICIELGDTYSGSGGAGGDYNENGLRDGQPKFKQSGWAGYDKADANSFHGYRKVDGTEANLPRAPRGGGDGWPQAKSLCLIPELYRIALVYGFNPLTGRQTPRWRARNVIRWCRPNPPVGALGDKVRPATSDMMVACKSARRFFDLDAIREPYKGNHKMGEAVGGKGADYGDDVRSGWSNRADVLREDRGGAPPLDHWWHDHYLQDAWLISTQPYKGSHYATWPEDLCIKPIEAMCPRRVCRECGKPSERITSTVQSDTGRTTNGSKPRDRAESFAGTTYETRTEAQVTTLGWSDCGHDNWRTGTILDPFAGSGTTLAVAVGHGRDAIGIDLDERNAELARERVGLFLTVDQ